MSRESGSSRKRARESSSRKIARPRRRRSSVACLFTRARRRDGFRNGPNIARYTAQLAHRVGQLLDEHSFPFVLGGDCSILLGPMLALRERGRYGLCFIDGHADFCYARDPKRRGRYTAAGLDLALATGKGPDALTNLQGRKPVVREPTKLTRWAIVTTVTT